MSLSASVQSCIQECLRCYQACQSNAAGMCLEQGGAHVEPEHMRLMLSCAEVCRTAAAVMLNQSPQHPVVCRACAELCSACSQRGLQQPLQGRWRCALAAVLATPP